VPTNLKVLNAPVARVENSALGVGVQVRRSVVKDFGLVGEAVQALNLDQGGGGGRGGSLMVVGVVLFVSVGSSGGGSRVLLGFGEHWGRNKRVYIGLFIVYNNVGLG
jgi:hypothetical protein